MLLKMWIKMSIHIKNGSRLPVDYAPERPRPCSKTFVPDDDAIF